MQIKKIEAQITRIIESNFNENKISAGRLALRQLLFLKKQSFNEIYADFSASRNDDDVRLSRTFCRFKECYRSLSRVNIRKSYLNIT